LIDRGIAPESGKRLDQGLDQGSAWIRGATASDRPHARGALARGPRLLWHQEAREPTRRDLPKGPFWPQNHAYALPEAPRREPELQAEVTSRSHKPKPPRKPPSEPRRTSCAG